MKERHLYAPAALRRLRRALSAPLRPLRFTALIILALAGPLALSGCDAPQKEETPVEYAPSEDRTLVIYTSHKEEVYRPIVEEFEERTGIWVDVVSGGTGELLKRISQETEDPQADVMFGGGVDSLCALCRLREQGHELLALHGLCLPPVDASPTAGGALPPGGLPLSAEEDAPRLWHVPTTADGPRVPLAPAMPASLSGDGAAAISPALPGLSEACRHLGVPLYLLDARERFSRAVIRPFVRAYAQGRTPNPCALRLLKDHLRLLDFCSDSLWATKLRTVMIMSLLLSRVLSFSASK